MRCARLSLLVFASLLLLAAATPAFGAVVTFDDRACWTGATRDVTTADFEVPQVGEYLEVGSPYTDPTTGLVIEGGPALYLNRIYSPTQNMSAQGSGSPAMTLVPPAPVTAIGYDRFQGAGTLTLHTTGGDVVLPYGNGLFFGVTSTDPITSVTIQDTGSGNIAVDNVSWGTATGGNNGCACTAASACTSGFCVDGVCCDSACDGGACQACSVASGAATNGICGASAGGVCRPAAGPCDLDDLCDGVETSCGADAKQPDGTPCPQGQCIAGACVSGADLSVAINAPFGGLGLSFNVVASNAGPAVATAVRLTITIPAGIIVSAGNGGGWSCQSAASGFSCTRPSLAVGAAPAINLVVVPLAIPTQLSATVSSAVVDPNPGNNSASRTLL